MISYANISKEAVEFFTSQLGAFDPLCTCGNLRVIRDLLNFIPWKQVLDKLINSISPEVRALVIKNFPPTKASSPGGYSAEFFKYSWEVTSKFVINAIQEFFY